ACEQPAARSPSQLRRRAGPWPRRRRERCNCYARRVQYSVMSAPEHRQVESQASLRPASDSPSLNATISIGTEPSPSSHPLAPLPAGTIVGDFELLHEVGRGGRGIVYQARQQSLGRIVALKLLPTEPNQKPVTVSRFLAEAQA